jgi:hypothetical protein
MVLAKVFETAVNLVPYLVAGLVAGLAVISVARKESLSVATKVALMVYHWAVALVDL